MTREEYIQLAQNSESFKGMDEALQEKVLKAEGHEMEHYITIFTDENKLLNQAYKDYMQDNENVLKNFKDDMKNVQAIKLEKTEQSEELLTGIK